MTLPAPNLDDRSFQELVDEAKRMVQRRWPEWTGWTARFATPLVLLGLTWLLFGRTGRRETQRFTRAVTAGSVCWPGETSTSGTRNAGLSQCALRKRSG